MEGKPVVLSVLILSLVMTQTQVEAMICCPSPNPREIYYNCHRARYPEPVCLSLSGCKDVSGSSCPPGFPYDFLQNSGNDVKGYCKLGCISSMCGAMTTLQNSGKANSDAASEIVKEAVDQCAKVCATICNKDSLKPGAETA